METRMPSRKRWLDPGGNLRQDLQIFLYNYVFHAKLDTKKAFELTYPDVKVSKYRGTRLFYYLMKQEKIKQYYEMLNEEKAKQVQLTLEIRDMLDMYKREGKFGQYNDLLKTYIKLIEDKKEAKSFKDIGDTIDITHINL